MTRLMLCSCTGTMSPDPEALTRATGLTCTKRFDALCTTESEAAQAALQEGDVIIACGQEQRRFQDLAAEVGAPEPLCIDIRDRDGWSAHGADTARAAALLAEGQVAPHPVPFVDLVSEGVCLVIGDADTAMPAAKMLSGALSVTCLLPHAPQGLMGHTGSYDIVAGRIRTATGAFTGFSLTLDKVQQVDPAGRGEVAFSAPVDGVSSRCDIILDLSGDPAMFPAHEKRDGYLRADPRRPAAVADAIVSASQLVGSFEKPLHIRFEESLCAHSRAGQSACTRCLSICPTGAILSAGDHVEIDPNICAGCGGCAAVCPTGAATLDDPGALHTATRIRTLATAYGNAGGHNPRLLVHDEGHGAELIRLSARHGNGLPPGILPLGLRALPAFGHAEALMALTAGFSDVIVLRSPGSDTETLDAEHGLADAVLDGLGLSGRLHVIVPGDPEALSQALQRPAATPIEAEPILPLGRRRDTARLAARALSGTSGTEDIPLPEGAPYGAVLVDTQACTLCHSCASLCPPGALGDNPDRPELRFKEDACVQCGLCVNVCPENAISLVPRLKLDNTALTELVLHEEDPFECIECGAAFGVRSTIEAIVSKLENNHALFTNSDNTRLIRMCDNCRVTAQFHGKDAPFQMGTPRRVRTTDDYRDGVADDED